MEGANKRSTLGDEVTLLGDALGEVVNLVGDGAHDVLDGLGMGRRDGRLIEGVVGDGGDERAGIDRGRGRERELLLHDLLLGSATLELGNDTIELNGRLGSVSQVVLGGGELLREISGVLEHAAEHRGLHTQR